jgi:predicted nucleic acid-binding protein
VIVVDASIIVEMLFRRPSGRVAETRFFEEGQTIHAPHLIDVEVGSALRRCARTGVAEPQRCEEALADFTNLSLRRYPHTILLQRMWWLRANLSAYDATYVALAEVLDAPLLTHDRRLAGATGHDARIELL